jgi:hypothetical protein
VHADGLHFGPYVRLPGVEVNDARVTPGFLVTDEPLSAWALEVDNASVFRTHALEHAYLPYLPYFNQIDRSPASITPVDGVPPGFDPSAAFDLHCKPTVFAVDPTRAARVMADAIDDACETYDADGVRLDEMTVTYAFEENVRDALVVMNSVDTKNCSWQRTVLRNPPPALAVKAGVGHFSEAPYARFQPEVCRGGDASLRANEDRRNPGESGRKDAACQIALDHALMRMLGEVSRLLTRNRFMPRRRLWPNMNPTLFSSRTNVEGLQGAAYATDPFADRYGALMGSEADTLALGGWFEKFVTDPNDRAAFPVPQDGRTGQPRPGFGVDASNQGIIVTGSGGRETLCIYRANVLPRFRWRGMVRWAIETARRGGPVRLDFGFTSIDDVQVALGSYLACRATTRGRDADPESWAKFQPGARPPAARAERTEGANVAVFPWYIHPTSNPDAEGNPDSSPFLQCGDGDAPERQCGDPCVTHVGDGGRLVAGFPAQLATARHPLVVRSVLGGPSSEPDGRDGVTPMRLLLDVVMGRTLGCAWFGPVLVAEFEYGQALVYPFVDHGTMEGDKTFRWSEFVDHIVRLPPTKSALYLANDAGEIDRLVQSRLRDDLLRGRLPVWSFGSSPGLRRALEAGLQTLDLPGVCARRVTREAPAVPLMPGMGRILVYEDSPTGLAWRAAFPRRLAGPDRYVSTTAADVIDDWMRAAVRDGAGGSPIARRRGAPLPGEGRP